MSRIIFIGLFFLIVNSSGAQTILILNESNSEPVEGVLLYSTQQSSYATSNDEGIVNVGGFKPGSTIIIQHPSFHTLSLSISDLHEPQTTIYLTEKIIRIEEVIISANRWEQNKSEIPFEILSLDAAKISSSNPQTSADILEATGQIFVQKSQLGGGSPMIRGFGANSVLIVVDGVRMNNTIFRSGNLQNVINIDPNTLESSEVIFGPGAVIYGSDALGGVMDFHTISPSFSKNNKVWVDGHVMARYSSANNEKTANAVISVGKNKLGYVGSISMSKFGDLRTGLVRPAKQPNFGKRPEYTIRVNNKDAIIANDNVNLQRFSGYKQISTLQKLVFRMNDYSELGYTFNYATTSDIPRYDRLTEYAGKELKYAQWNYGPQKWMMNAIKFKYFDPNKLFDALKFTVGHQFFEESRHTRRFRENLQSNRKEQVSVVTINSDFEKVINEKTDIFYGVEYSFNHVNSSAYEKDIETEEVSSLSTRYPDGGSNVHSLGMYGSYKHKLKDQLFLSAGLRFNYQNLKSKFNSKEFEFSAIENVSSAVNGNLGLVLKPNSNWNLSAMVSTGFRAPNVDDISKVFDSEPGNVVVPNPDLLPEYSYNAELSFLRYLSEKTTLRVSGFYSFLRDAMVRGDYDVNGKDSIIYDGELSRVQAIVNTGKANIYGFSIGLNTKFAANWSGSASLNLTDGLDLEQNEPLRHTTPLFGMVSIAYSRRKLMGEFYCRFNGKRSFENLAPSERNKPHLYSSDGSLAWFTLNFRSSYTLSSHFEINGALENILDHHYRTYSSGISAPGRNFVLSLKVKF